MKPNAVQRLVMQCNVWIHACLQLCMNHMHVCMCADRSCHPMYSNVMYGRMHVRTSAWMQECMYLGRQTGKETQKHVGSTWSTIIKYHHKDSIKYVCSLGLVRPKACMEDNDKARLRVGSFPFCLAHSHQVPCAHKECTDVTHQTEPQLIFMRPVEHAELN